MFETESFMLQNSPCNTKQRLIHVYLQCTMYNGLLWHEIQHIDNRLIEPFALGQVCHSSLAQRRSIEFYFRNLFRHGLKNENSTFRTAEQST